VFLATVSGPGGFEKVVALKRIHPHLAQETDFVDMFLDEARIASRIHHANVCQVFDFGATDDTYFIAMEYLVGEPLSRIMKTIRKTEGMNATRLPMLACKVVLDACEGLHAAHELRGRDGELLNVVHRDVSPQNLFITYDGNVKVVDFGIASASDRVHHTSAGQVKGKFSYMAPEQSRGGKIDRRADVWALGVVLWEMLTLRRLFRRETTVETLTAMLNDEVPPPSAYNPDLPPGLDAIVLKALQRNPDERYATARDFGRDLSRFAGLTGMAASSADLAEWMDQLFPSGRSHAYGVMDAAQRGELDLTVVTPHVEVSESEVQPIQGGGPAKPKSSSMTPSSMSPPPLLAQGIPLGGPTGAYPAQPIQQGGGKPLVYAALGAAGVLLVVGIGGAIAWTALSPSEEEAVSTVETRPPEQATVPEPTTLDENPVPVGVMPTTETTETAETPVEPTPNESRRTKVRRVRNTGMQEQTQQTQQTQQTVETQPAPTATSGPVAILTPGGWANVYDESGRHLGQTPLRVTLPVGTHRLSLRPFGQPPNRTVRVTVTGEGTARVVHPLSE
jgi:serine/threonine-protein kinase